MAVVGIAEYWKQRAGKFNYTFYPSDEIDRYFLVETNAKTDDAIVILDAMAVNPPEGPGVVSGGAYPTSAILTVRSIVPKQKAESAYWWDVLVHYEDSPLMPNQNPNPLLREARIKFKSVRYQKAIIKTADTNQMMCNSANDPYPPYMADGSRWTITIEKNYGYNSVPGWVLTCNDGVNSDDWNITQLGLTVPQYCGKISEVDVTDILSENVGGIPVLYRTLTLGVDVNPDNWQLVVQDAGFRAINNGDVSTNIFPVGTNVPGGQLYYVMVADQLGHPVYPTNPLPLDGTGALLTQSQVAAGNFMYNTFNIYQLFDFTQIPTT